VVGPPVTASAWAPLAVHSSANADAAASTGSLNVISTSPSSGTSEAPSAGSLLATDGASSASGSVPPLRGAGGPAVKSLALSSVSTLPAPARSAAVVLESPGAAPDPSKKFALP
jgi:hypothetical protein